jgi:hypothetical protein
MTDEAAYSASSKREVEEVLTHYRVTWKSIETGELHVREFSDVDQGYSYYELMQRDSKSYGATWDHVNRT